MRKAILLITVAFFCLALIGCTSALIEDLLEAPSLTADQTAIMRELSEITTEKVVLKYPTSGTIRAPIQFVDLTGDAKEEAVAFFSIPATGIMTRIAVLSQNVSGEWEILSEIEGAGTDVVSLNAITLKDSLVNYILVEWESVSINERKVSIYNFLDGKLNIGFEERCSDILLTDLNGDKFTEFCYIAEPLVPGVARIYLVDYKDGKFQTIGEHSLEGTLGNSSMVYGNLNDGNPAVFVDQTVEGEMQTTEVFMVSNEEFIRADYVDEYDISSVALRKNTDARTMTFSPDLVTYIPSSAALNETMPSRDILTYWYSVGNGEIEYAATSYYSREYAYNLTLPPSWVEFVTVTVSEENTRKLQVLDMRPTEQEDTQQGPPQMPVLLLEFEVLGLGEDSTHLTESGFEILSSQGTYRYFFKSYGTQEETEYIKDYFSIS